MSSFSRLLVGSASLSIMHEYWVGYTTAQGSWSDLHMESKILILGY